MAQRRKNLIASALSLVIALVLLATGTFAWYTLSTTATTSISATLLGNAWPAEISLDYGEYASASNPDPTEAHWGKTVALDTSKIGDNNRDALVSGLLRPITTYDLKHWYVTDYDAKGNAKGFEERKLNEIANIANITAIPSDNQDSEGTGEESIEEENNYVIYTDIWVRVADDEDSFYLRLNNPGYDNESNTIKVNDFETDYGTFLMWTPEFKYDDEGKITVDEESSINAMASMRIGFLVYDDEDSIPCEDETDAVVRATPLIYEPNGDLHQEHNAMDKAKQSQQASAVYVQDYENSSSEKSSINASGSTVGEYSMSKEEEIDGHFLTTKVPKYYKNSDDEDAWEMKEQPVNIRQKASEWNEDSDWIVDNEGNLLVSSKNLKSIGDFVKDDGEEIAAPYSELPPIAKIENGKIKRIRIFFWIEGQDIDCWNQIAGGKLYANLEFRGDPVAQTVAKSEN